MTNESKPHAAHEIQAEFCRNDFHYFVKKAWKIVEPGTIFMDNWHIGIICEYLQAVTAGEIQNLIINIPPRHMKSLLVTVFWPTWTWTHTPQMRWLTGSYSDLLAVHDALKTGGLSRANGIRRCLGRCFN